MKEKVVPALKNKEDSARIAALLEKAWDLQSKDPDSCLYYAKQGEQQAIAKKYPELEAEANNRFGNLEEANSKYTTAIGYYYTALRLDSSIQYQPGCARDLYAIANMLKRLGQYEEAKKDIKLAISTWKKIPGQETRIGAALINLGNIYMRQGKADSAILCFQQCDSIALKNGSEKLKADVLNSTGLVYEQQHYYDKAMLMYSKSLELEEKRGNENGIAIASNNMGNMYYLQKKFPEALAAYKRSVKLKEDKHLRNAAAIYTNIGLVYEAQGDIDQALYYHQKSYYSQNESGDQQETAISANNLGWVLRRIGREKEANNYFNLAYTIAQQTGGKLIELEVLNSLSQSTAALHNYPLAYNYSLLQHHLRDSIEETMRKGNEIDALYREEQNERKLLEKENARVTAESQRNSAVSSRRIIIASALFIGIFLIALLFLALLKMNRDKHRVIVAEQQERLNRQKAEDVIKNQELIVLRSIFHTQQKERQRIAKDLHDRLGLKLSTARLYYNLVGKLAVSMNEEEKKQYANGNRILDEASNELREVAHDLSSGVIMRFGLAQAVQQLCETLQEASELKINFYASGLDNRIDSHSEFQVYQVIQELLTNILRHAKAQHATVQLSRYNHTLNVLVEDDGKGFARNEEKQGTGIGLKNIRERVLKLNGSLQIDSNSGRGTTVSIDITIP